MYFGENSAESGLALWQRVVLAFLERIIQLSAHSLVDLIQLLISGPAFPEETLDISIDGIFGLPLGQLTLRLISLVIVLRVTFAAVRLYFQQPHTFALSGLPHQPACDLINCDNIVAIDRMPRDSVSLGLLSEIRDFRLAISRG